MELKDIPTRDLLNELEKRITPSTIKDNPQYRTLILDLYEKNLLTPETVLKELGFDPEQEIAPKVS